MNKNDILTFATDLVSIQSVSTDPAREGQMQTAVDYLREKLEQMGFEILITGEEKPYPLFVASRFIDPLAKTIGIYGHYDVQPEDPVEQWDSDPFVLVQKHGKLIARGIADNKGHLVQNVSAVESLIESGELKNNIVFIFEGEEELGSEHFEEFVLKAKDIIAKVDVFYITDSDMFAKNVPQIEYAMRGIMSYELEVVTGDHDLHSGTYGNRVLNPINVLADLVAKIKDVKTGHIKIPEFYDDVRKISAEERTLLKKVQRTDEEDMAEAQTLAVVSLDDENPSLSPKIYPSFDVHGIIGGYTGVGSKNIVPAKASMKFSFRLVENQDPKKIHELVTAFISEHLPKGVKHTLTDQGACVPFYTSIDNEFVKKTAQIMKEVFDNEVVFNRSGGTIGAAEVLQKHFKKPIVLTGFVLPDCGMHSPNENFDEDMFWKGIECLKRIYREI